MEKITELIDEKAFAQLERLLKDLGIAHTEFLSLVGDVEKLNAELGKTKGFKDFENAVGKVVTAQEKMEKGHEKTVVAAQKAVTAEKELVQATRMKITQDMSAKKILETYSGTIDENIKVQVRLKLALKDIRAEQKNLDKSYKENKISADQYGSEVERLAKVELEAREGLRDYNLELKRSLKEANAAQGSYDQLSATLDRLRGLMRRLTDEEKANIEVGGRLQAAIDEYDEQLKKADESMGVHTRKVGNYENALSRLPGPIGKLVAGWDDLVNLSGTLTESLDSTANAGEGVGAGLTAAETGTKGFRAGLISMTKAALAFLATPVGATIAAISAGLLAAKGWYEYNKNLVEATRLTKQLTGLGGDDLKAFRSEVQATASTFDKDFREVLVASNATAKQFGISQQEALDIVNKGFLAGADASGEFLDQLREYPSQLKQVGLTAEETTAIITQNVQDGIYSDKGIDAIKEAGIRIREMTPVTKDAFKAIGMSGEEIQKQLEDGTISMFDVIQKVSGKLKELPADSQAVGMVLADIFGGAGEDAGLDYIKKLEDIDTNLDSLVAKQGKVAEAQLKQLEATEELDKAFASLFDSTGGGFELLIANAKIFSTEVLTGIIDGIIQVINYFIDLYNESALVRGGFEAVIATAKTALDTLGFAFSFLLNNVKDVGKIISAILTGNIDDISGIINQSKARNAKAVEDYGKDLAENYLGGWNNTVKGRKIERIVPGLNTTGAAGKEPDPDDTDSGGNEGDKETIALTKEQIDLIKRLRDAYLDLEIARSSRTAAVSKRIADDEKKSFEDREAALNNYLYNSEEALRTAAEKELGEADLTKDERTRIEEQLQNDLVDLRQEGVAMSSKILMDQLSKDDQERVKAQAKVLAGIQQEGDERLLALEKSYQNGEKSELDYANERLAIQRDTNRKLVLEEIKAVEALIEINKARGLDTFEQERQLAALRVKLSKDTTDKQIDDAKKLFAEESKIKEAKSELISELDNLATTLILAQFEQQNEALDAQSEKIDLNKEKQIERVEESVASEEDKAIKIAQIEAQAQSQQEAIEQKRRDLQQKQAIFEKAAALARITAATAQAVMVQLAGAPFFPISGPLIPLIIGIGAAQAAQVIATPIPQFADGTSYSPAGWALTDERGAETYIEPGGKTFYGSDSGANYKYLKPGTKIIPADKTREMAANMGMGSILAYDGSGKADTDKLVKVYEKGFDRMEKAMKNKKESSTIITGGGIQYIYKSGNSRQQYLKRNLG